MLINSEKFQKFSAGQLIDISMFPEKYTFVKGDINLDSLLQNQNLINLSDKIIINLLELMKAKKQRFFQYTIFELLLHSESVRKWAFDNMTLHHKNDLYIQDRENY